MRVILLQDIAKLGQTGDVKNVANGYARNFLLPRNLVQIATKKTLEIFAERQAIIGKKQEAREIAEKNIVKKLDGLSLTLRKKTSKTGVLYGAIEPAEILEELRKMGFTGIAKKHIIIDTPIKRTGTHQILLTFHNGETVTITLNVTQEE